MSSVEEISTPLIDSTAADGSPLVDINEPPNSSTSEAQQLLVVQSTTPKDTKINPHRQRNAANISIAKTSRRLSKRKDILHKLSFVNDIICFIAAFGIILMIVHNEIRFARNDRTPTLLILTIKPIVTFSTVILIGLILYYHRLDIYLYSINNSIEDYRMTITNKKILLIALEIVICAIHPIPLSFSNHEGNSVHDADPSRNISIHTSPARSYISFDVAFGVPMFMRVYLFSRFIMFHSHLFHDTSSRSISYFNKQPISFLFLMKTYLKRMPLRCLVTFCVSTFLVGSWCLRASTVLPEGGHLSMLDSMWLFIVTFTTVGYGDFVPTTYYARCVAAMIAMVGVFSSALVIAVVSQNILLSRWERYIHTYLLRSELANERTVQAANVIKFALKSWHLKRRKSSGSSIRYFQAQRKLFESLCLLSQVKQRQRRLVDACVDSTDLLTTERDTNRKLYEINKQFKLMKIQIDNLEKKFTALNSTMCRTIDDINHTLNILLQKMAK